MFKILLIIIISAFNYSIFGAELSFSAKDLSLNYQNFKGFLKSKTIDFNLADLKISEENFNSDIEYNEDEGILLYTNNNVYSLKDKVFDFLKTDREISMNVDSIKLTQESLEINSLSTKIYEGLKSSFITNLSLNCAKNIGSKLIQNCLNKSSFSSSNIKILDSNQNLEITDLSGNIASENLFLSMKLLSPQRIKIKIYAKISVNETNRTIKIYLKKVKAGMLNVTNMVIKEIKKINNSNLQVNGKNIFINY